MPSFLAEAVFCFTLFLLLTFLYGIREKYLVLTSKGWDKLLLGMFILFAGSIFDLVDNFKSIQQIFLLGNFPIDLLLKVSFYVLGIILVISGPLNWLSEILAWKRKEMEKDKIVKLLSIFPAKGREHKSVLDMFDFVLCEVARYLQAEFGAVFLLDDLKEFLILESHLGLSIDTVRNLERTKLNLSTFSGVVKDGTAKILNDIFSEESKLALQLKEDRLESLLAVPILVKGQVLGVMAVFSREKFRFNQFDAKPFASIGEQMGEIVENMRLKGELLRKEERLKKVEGEVKIISQIGQMLNSGQSTDKVLNRIAVDCLRLVEASDVTLFSIDNKELIVRSTLDETLIGKKFKISDFLPVRETIETKKPVAKTEMIRGAEPELNFTKREVKSSLAVPVLFGDKILGALFFENHEHTRTYSAWEIEQLQMMAGLVGMVLQNENVQEKLKSLVGQKGADVSLEKWSNDINNMLAGILGNIQLLQERIADKRVISAHQTAEYLKTVEEAVLATSKIVKKIQKVPEAEKEEKTFTRRVISSKELLPKEKIEIEKEKYKVLVIDDQEIIRDLVENILKGMGYRAVCAANGTEGLEEFKKQGFDLVITDLGMPDISGWEVSSRIKSQKSDIPIILITGWGIHPDPNKLKDSGIDFMLAKPFKVDQLEKTIRDAVELIKAKK